jgi:hypothetical protein
MQGSGRQVQGWSSAATHIQALHFTPARRGAVGGALFHTGLSGASEFAKGRFDWQKGMQGPDASIVPLVSHVAHTSRPPSGRSFGGEHAEADRSWKSQTTSALPKVERLTFNTIDYIARKNKPAVDGWCAVYPFPVYSVMLWWLGRRWCGRLCVTGKWLETEDLGLFLPHVPLPGLALSLCFRRNIC